MYTRHLFIAISSPVSVVFRTIATLSYTLLTKARQPRHTPRSGDNCATQMLSQTVRYSPINNPSGAVSKRSFINPCLIFRCFSPSSFLHFINSVSLCVLYYSAFPPSSFFTLSIWSFKFHLFSLLITFRISILCLLLFPFFLPSFLPIHSFLIFLLFPAGFNPFLPIFHFCSHRFPLQPSFIAS